jgi:hypothetical protein
LDTEVKDTSTEFRDLEKNHKKREKSLLTEQKSIETLSQESALLARKLIKVGIMNESGELLRAALPNSEADQINKEIAKLRTDVDNINEQIQIEVQPNLLDERKKMNECEKMMRQAKEHLDKMDDVRDQKLEGFKKTNHVHVYNAVLWVREHRHLFHGKIFEPVALEMNISNNAFADAVESTIGNDALVTFVFCDVDDYKLAQRELIDKNRWRVNLEVVKHPLSHYKSNLSKNEIRQLGFDGFIIDYIQAPEEILSVLCGRSNIHNIVRLYYPFTISLFLLVS